MIGLLCLFRAGIEKVELLQSGSSYRSIAGIWLGKLFQIIFRKVRKALRNARSGSRARPSPGQTFYCWHCALIEGVLASFPTLGSGLDIERIDWQRPRKGVIALAGEDNQSLPLLIVKDGDRSEFETGMHDGRSLIADPHKILAALTERHGFPPLHP